MHLLGGSVDSGNDLHIPGATAEIAGNAFTNLRFGWLLRLLQEADGRHNHAGCAVAALETVVLVKCGLDRVHVACGA